VLVVNLDGCETIQYEAFATILCAQIHE
jgi:hypothetical protein